MLDLPEAEGVVRDLWIYVNTSMSRRMIRLDKMIGHDTPEFFSEELQRFNADSDEGFAIIDKKASAILGKLGSGDIAAKRAVANGDGQVTLQLPPGSYMIVTLTNHRKNKTDTEYFHAVAIKGSSGNSVGSRIEL
ncbi:MAG: hypothetical protein HY050_03125 [Actinobacteria bacterium]|nr:hypothetical protein [Actinomycetota bacterium]